VGSDLDLAIAGLLDFHNITEVSDTAVDLDLVLEELLESGDIEDLVAGGLRSVDDELAVRVSPQCPNCNIGKEERERREGVAYLLRHLGLLALGS